MCDNNEKQKKQDRVLSPFAFVNPSCPGRLYNPKSIEDVRQRAREAGEEFLKMFGKKQ